MCAFFRTVVVTFAFYMVMLFFFLFFDQKDIILTIGTDNFIIWHIWIYSAIQIYHTCYIHPVYKSCFIPNNLTVHSNSLAITIERRTYIIYFCSISFVRAVCYNKVYFLTNFD